MQVRKAFALAIDTDTTSHTVMNRVRPPLKGVFQDDVPLNVPWKTHDKAQAEALLDAAGWKRTGNGPRTMVSNTLSTVITTYDSDLETIATAAIDMLSDDGFDAKGQPEPESSPILPLVTGAGPVRRDDAEPAEHRLRRQLLPGPRLDRDVSDAEGVVGGLVPPGASPRSWPSVGGSCSTTRSPQIWSVPC